MALPVPSIDFPFGLAIPSHNGENVEYHCWA